MHFNYKYFNFKHKCEADSGLITRTINLKTMNPTTIMKKYVKIVSFIASGVALGAIAGKFALEEKRKAIRDITGKPARNVKNYLFLSMEDNDYSDYSFI